ncbi:MAG: NAD(P)/FAD-dependent oxidoreductase, partial [Candidatus Heimdallarchaeota archaeon]|nr:NAD(P)/FAD-dependent oxidoreductase [Candidatus Heimdallarchaeota archaeon]MCK4877485.1 NAD(P)/FAD-dependent oxidoreductase [Candidatus Heimdallarchaeota archaeon]
MIKKIQTYVALVGGGPACSTAAIQLIRSGIEVLIVTERIGGTIRNANLMENLVGFPKGISGEEYVTLMEEQLEHSRIPIVKDRVNSISKANDKYVILTEESEILSDYLIIGTGSKPCKLNIKGEDEAFNMNKLYYEIYNAIADSKGKEITVIGSGDVAYDYSLNLSKIAKKIIIVQRTEETKSLPILQRRVEEEKIITVTSNRIPYEIFMENERVILATKTDKEISEIQSDLIIVAVGREPNIEFLSEALKEEDEHPKAESNLYFIGDVKKGNYRQVSVAMGDGMNVAMEIVKKLSRKEDYNGTPRQVW